MTEHDVGAAAAAAAAARALPDVDEGVACAGTAIESRTFRTAKKSFLFLGGKAGAVELRLKLGPGLDGARAAAARAPDQVQVGATGWVTVRLPPGAPLPDAVPAWIAESHGLFARSRR